MKKTLWLAGAAMAALLAAAAIGAVAAGHRGGPSAASDNVVVHGNWKIAIKNPDGRVVRVHRFHNEFNGANILSRVFAHALTPGRYWLLVADSAGLNNPCEITSSGSAFQTACSDFESDDPNAGAAANFFSNLTATATAANTLVITGDILAQRDGQFDRVVMRSSSCGATTAPSACHTNGYISWSDRTLGSPITLVDGQHALVTVTYTFSPAP
ncbi:MAG TPA: hypothetical protein VGJ77_10730 [Gaiellaceae bacterium]